MRTSVILHNVRSVHNVGSIFRTADGAGVSVIYLTGYTPAPIDRFGRVRRDMQKTALGATETVAWEAHTDAAALIRDLKARSVCVVAVEQTAHSVDYRDVRAVGRDVTFVFGNEIEGVPPSLCALADMVVQIPLSGTKESLNVSVAAGIILFHFRDR